MEENDGKFWLGTYDTSTLTSVFTQLTDGQLAGLSEGDYKKRVDQFAKLLKSLSILQEEDEAMFNKVFGSEGARYSFESVQALINATTGNTNPVEKYKEIMDEYNKFKDLITDYEDNSSPEFNELMEKIDDRFLEPSDKVLEDLRKVVYYFGVNYYMKQSVPGFDLMVSEDGINFEVVTDDGFGDESNHGVRTLTSADGGKNLYLGTANPFYGAQYWRGTTKTPETPDQTEITINFRSGLHGKFAENQKTEYTIKKGESVGGAPKVIADKKWKHVGWKVMNDKRLYSTRDILSMKFDVSTDIVAVYRVKDSINDSVDQGTENNIKVKFEEGSHGKLVGTNEYKIAPGTKLNTVPAVVAKDGYKFKAWKNKEDGKKYSNDEVMDLTLQKDTVFVAEYRLDNEVAFNNKPYIQGYPDGSFMPNGQITREEVVTIFNNIIKDEYKNSKTEPIAFTDVKSDRWSYDAINNMSKISLVNGYPDGSFAPGNPITRAEFVKIVSMFLETSNDAAKFPDVESSHWASKDIKTVASHGLIVGYPDGKFLPENKLTRAEAVSIINKLIKRDCEEGKKVEYTKAVKKYTDLDASHWAFELINKASNEFTCKK